MVANQEIDLRKPSFEKLWFLQENFYLDRGLMWLSNQNVLHLLARIEEEAHECREEIIKCMDSASLDTCINLMSQEIRQEVSDILLFTLALARCIGLTETEVMEDAIYKIARNTGRYLAKDFSDTTLNYDDQIEKSRSEDKRRGYTNSFYQIAA
jgi:NTP pyrophosphatase (non-canonical NTP hydrolase)